MLMPLMSAGAVKCSVLLGPLSDNARCLAWMGCMLLVTILCAFLIARVACAGVLGLSRFASLADAMDRQGSVPAASVAFRDSPTPSRAASCGQFEVMAKGNLASDD